MKVIKEHPLTAYFLFAYAITWLGVLPLVATTQGWWPVAMPESWHIAGAFGPIVAAVIVTAVTRNRSGLKEFAQHLAHWHVGWQWQVTAIGSPLAIAGAAILLLRLLGHPWPDFTPLWSAFRDGTWVLNLFIASVGYGFGEEPGWRGFALPRLQQRYRPVVATLILAVFWALWHLPMFFYHFDFAGLVTIIGFFTAMFAGALWLTFLYNHTGASTLMCALWHTVWNVMNVGLAVVSDDIVAFMSMLVIALALFVSWRLAPNTHKPHIQIQHSMH